MTDKKSYYIFGTHASLAALNNPLRVIRYIYCTESCFLSLSKSIQKHNYKIVTTNFLHQLLGRQIVHQGIAVNTIPLTINGIKNIDLNTPNYKIAILDQLLDHNNLGAIIRSAAAFNISTIILPENNSIEENGTIAKIAVGALEKINLVKVKNLYNTINYLKKHGFWIIGLDLNNSNQLTEQTFHSKMAFVLGSENKGLRNLTRQQCDFLIKIPMSHKTESLNVAGAATIIFYESFKFSIKQQFK
ncbi:23S rRNA (guanosine(2251)-2'-O)-methyltransferase RlmB [Orientia tsutsugamushi]|uniref:RNA 2'-O ribose methyltransferase substrate binding family protein n=2 Tax=Orientia tsutsugamushi TaxID=784 RepID=A0A0F3PCM0_ORITS|nr:23S rRNA (guanosine(2251)-2'-O)-methyltransferase RlmB [Orientia tsutsugamushi]KJV57615.1 RNA 2'-O ribose methyltransferase substrate binding family protein [Orientia tsutsugamushi str. Karp]KJV77646.1 RNA 2'-O ribose methyltransferase substrate binding family protein [Orientia tsutsugamushi str. TA716]SPR15039.1 23S rRNA (guanosine(2251)-2'-O)-methyltransferase RlmB [Orientia tsutsugamushi]